MAATESNQVNLDGLRQRNKPQQAASAEQAKDAVQGLNAEELLAKDENKEQRTFGRTPDGIGESTRCVFHAARSTPSIEKLAFAVAFWDIFR